MPSAATELQHVLKAHWVIIVSVRRQHAERAQDGYLLDRNLPFAIEVYCGTNNKRTPAVTGELKGGAFAHLADVVWLEGFVESVHHLQYKSKPTAVC